MWRQMLEALLSKLFGRAATRRAPRDALRPAVGILATALMACIWPLDGYLLGRILTVSVAAVASDEFVTERCISLPPDALMARSHSIAPSSPRSVANLVNRKGNAGRPAGQTETGEKQ